MSSRNRDNLNVRQNDSLSEFENFKRKFLLANKHITKLNSVLSIRIEELQAEISTLYVENLRLRASEIALVTQREKEQEESRKILQDAEAATSNLAKHFHFLRQSLNTDMPNPRTPPSKPKPFPQSRQPTSHPNGSLPIPRLSRAPNLTDIFEDDEAEDSHNLDHELQLPNDLTNQITREGHDPVASGGFADIYKGILRSNTKKSIQVAVKALRTYSGKDTDFTKKEKRLRRELKVWLSLEHANVLPLLGTTTEFGRFPAMVCPWAENGTLISYLNDYHAVLSVVEILRLLMNVASGLQYLHSCHIVHGDLSGSNILINKSGNAWIADFGLSTLLTELGGSTFATSFHARGTVRWMAPELLNVENDDLQEGPVSASPMTLHDIFSFGGVMLHILSGKVPYYYYTNDMQVVYAVSKGIKPTRPNNPLVTECRWAFIQRCWSTNDINQMRPTSDDVVDFTKNELTIASHQSSTDESTFWGVRIEVDEQDRPEEIGEAG